MEKGLKDRLLEALSRNKSGHLPIARADRDGPIGLSFAQQRLWFVAQLDGASQAYHMPAGLRLRGDLDEAALVRALDRIVYRHEVLRTRFVKAGDEPVQVIDPPGIGFALDKKDLSSTPQQDRDDQLQALAEAGASAPFDLAAGPLIRGTLVRLGEQDHALLVTMHHIISDGWSVGVLVSEFNQLYEAYCTDRPDPLPPLPIQYADYALWQRGQLDKDDLDAQARYWQEKLRGAPRLLELPTDRARPLVQDYRGERIPIHFDTDLTGRLRLAAASRGMTPFVLVLAAVAVVLSRLSNQDDIVIGTPTANRRRSEVEGLIGFFVNTLVLRIDAGKHIDAATFVEQVRQTAVAAQANQDLPFEQVVEMASPERSMSVSPVFQVMFAWQNTELVTPRIAGLDLQSLADLDKTSKFDLTFDLREVGDRIEGHLEYATSLFERVTIERYSRYLTGSLTGLLDALENEAAVPMSLISILSPDERHQLIEGFNATAVDYPAHALVHELFEEQVALSPEAVALVFEEESLTYGALEARANRLAHHLVSLGVKPDERVAICVERSIEMVVGLLAVLKAGGAYVPLDPAYPPDRLAYMLEDCNPVAILTHAPARNALEAARAGMEGQDTGAKGQGTAAPVIDLVADAFQWADLSANAPDIRSAGMTSANLAYVIYTSGSTGLPKGAMNEHRALINRLTWMQEAYRLDADDTLLQKTPFSFDVSVWEFFWPLMAGARLVLARPDGHKDARYLTAVIARHQVTTLHFVPSMLALFLEAADADACRSLRRVVCSGEALPGDLAHRCKGQIAGADLYNLYGPTEAAIDVTAWTCPADIDRGDIIPIGRPIANTRIYILDGRGEPVPVGVAGELHIGGAGVARGYLNRP
ncbi:amino acid adenylation domain-containing protein, partial [Rhizobium leguminosarum]|uniref:amino acid adenylation domain-containing protein n=1 Tax=Rhizobium leguminosarum TaxID=384 RepID=UPI001031CAF0